MSNIVCGSFYYFCIYLFSSCGTSGSLKATLKQENDPNACVKDTVDKKRQLVGQQCVFYLQHACQKAAVLMRVPSPFELLDQAACNGDKRERVISKLRTNTKGFQSRGTGAQILSQCRDGACSLCASLQKITSENNGGLLVGRSH